MQHALVAESVEIWLFANAKPLRILPCRRSSCLPRISQVILKNCLEFEGEKSSFNSFNFLLFLKLSSAPGKYMTPQKMVRYKGFFSSCKSTLKGRGYYRMRGRYSASGLFRPSGNFGHPNLYFVLDVL